MDRTYLRGDMYYADLGKGVGSEQEGYRPVVIIQNDVGNRHSPTVIIAAITSSLDFEVTPHQLRHTYITNLLYFGVDPKTVQYLAGHENSKTTMDIYAKIKYNKPKELLNVVNAAFHQVAPN